MKNILILAALLSVSAAQGATITQSSPFNFSQTYESLSGSSVVVIPASSFTAEFNTFDTTLGTLTSVTVVWTFSGTSTGTVGAPGGGYSISGGGAYTVNDLAYASGGGGGGFGGAPGTEITFNFPTLNQTRADEFFSGDVFYDEFTSGSKVTTSWEAPWEFTSGSTNPITITNLSITAGGSVTVVYDYVPVPEVSSAAMVLGAGLLTLRRRR